MPFLGILGLRWHFWHQMTKLTEIRKLWIIDVHVLLLLKINMSCTIFFPNVMRKLYHSSNNSGNLECKCETSRMQMITFSFILRVFDAEAQLCVLHQPLNSPFNCGFQAHLFNHPIFPLCFFYCHTVICRLSWKLKGLPFMQRK